MTILLVFAVIVKLHFIINAPDINDWNYYFYHL